MTAVLPEAAAPAERTGAPRWLVRMLAVACGLTAANLYYCQPLLPRIAHAFNASPASAGALVTTTQLGYALGLVLLVPLGDIARRRRLVCLLLVGEAAALLLSAAAPTLWVLLPAGTVVGLGASAVQILLPYAATIAAERERGRVMASLLSGVLLGVLLSRSVAGLLGDALGWRAVFLCAAVATSALAVLLGRVLVESAPEVTIGYRAQLKATFALAAAEPLLRRRSLIGACVFGGFGVFWATIAFLLTNAPYRFDQSEIGAFALLGAVGAIASKLVGRAADAGAQRWLTGALLVLGAASFGAIWLGGRSLVWLVIGVLVMDAAVHGTHLLNMSVVYGLVDAARSRIASVYMTSYFLGGAAGSAAGTTAYRLGGWPAVAAAGAVFMGAGLCAWAGGVLRERG
jgi:predicted MFS family arabinose efflux permease